MARPPSRWPPADRSRRPPSVLARLAAASRLLLALVLAALLLPGAPARAAAPPVVGRVTGLPVPRFVSLRADAVNLRVGPGRRYPIAWVIHRRHLPVEVVRESGEWRQTVLPDGAQGWIHSSLLTSRRTLAVRSGPLRTLRAAASRTAAPLARLEPEVIGRILFCRAGAAWCRVEVAGIEGFLDRAAFWGTLPAEAVPG